MYSDWVLVIFLGLVLIWLGVLSFFIWRQANFLEKLFPSSGERDIRKKFEEVIATVSGFKGDLSELREKLGKVEADGLVHLQRVNLLRYNPYDDTGGDQSFSVALLDEKSNGLVITSLHSRAGTRVFAKPVVKGKAESYNFSKEEEEVIKVAMK